mgnify:CR=1 FL=1
MSTGVGLLIDAATELATRIAKAIAKETGADEAVTFEIAERVAREYVAQERKAVTNARDAALAKAKRKR